MKLTIHSRRLDKDITFSIPGDSYIFTDLWGGEGTLGSQICSGGRLTGSTLAYCGDEQKKFDSICRRWYRAYLRQYRDWH